MSLIAHGPVLWIPAGNWAEWVGAIGTVAAFWAVVITWTKDRRRTLALDESAQARLVSVYTLGGASAPVDVYLTNVSRFPVAKVEVVLLGGGLRHTVWSSQSETMVLVPNDRPQIVTVHPVANVQWHVDMAFTDNNGQRWYRDGSGRLTKVPLDFSLVDEGTSI